MHKERERENSWKPERERERENRVRYNKYPSHRYFVIIFGFLFGFDSVPYIVIIIVIIILFFYQYSIISLSQLFFPLCRININV